VRVLSSPTACAAALDAARAAGRTVGLVPTMGALHEGHRSLVERAARECDVVVVTIFVNPTQFGDPADLAHYPRTPGHDLAVCKAAGASLVLVPEVADMYPPGASARATVSVSELAATWEGASRPGHFDGVATLVAKLFAVAGRCRAYFGEKDFQQLAVIRRMAADLLFPVEVVGCTTVREPDGLALSSRNVRLSDDERRAAVVLSRALGAGRASVDAGEERPAAVVAEMARVVADEPLVALDYAAVVDPADLAVPARLEPGQELRLLIAARVGPVRLIDNCAAGCFGAVPAPEEANAPDEATGHEGWTGALETLALSGAGRT
jgi:pantoate--beta-alanine ligase